MAAVSLHPAGPKVPDWLRDVGLGLLGFFGAKTLGGIGGLLQERQAVRIGLDRLTRAVEGIGLDLRDMKVDSHQQGVELKDEIHLQVTGLREDLKEHKREVEGRVEAINNRIDLLIRPLPDGPRWSKKDPAGPPD